MTEDSWELYRVMFFVFDVGRYASFPFLFFLSIDALEGLGEGFPVYWYYARGERCWNGVRYLFFPLLTFLDPRVIIIDMTMLIWEAYICRAVVLRGLTDAWRLRCVTCTSDRRHYTTSSRCKAQAAGSSATGRVPVRPLEAACSSSLVAGEAGDGMPSVGRSISERNSTGQLSGRAEGGRQRARQD